MSSPIVTIVGGSGFVGRHTVKRFADAGWRVNILCRDIIAAEFLKTAGTVGQIVLQRVDITKPEALEGKFAGSDVVINLVSILYQSGNQKFEAINVKGAQLIAEHAKKAGAKKFIQISALSPNPDSRYGHTKLAGEEAVRAKFPNATILRPSLIIGPEDGFFQRFGRMSLIAPALPLIAGGHTRFQPVTVENVATAIFTAATSDVAGKTFELAGPKTYSMKELLKLMLSLTGRKKCLISIPAPIASLMGWVSELLPLPPQITRDQVRLLKTDNVASADALQLKDLGIAPTAIESVLPTLLERFNAR
ncbi:MAG: complex I NDUFA9 subunit family protein [Alphaproteobacteria bacterium]|nr:complex I NDUFA9 subunit family protein [Alphaproteobacteria bacterium]